MLRLSYQKSDSIVVTEYRTSEEMVPELVNAILERLDDSLWQFQGQRDGVRVYGSPSPNNPYLGYRTVMEVRATHRKVVDFLGGDLFEAMSRMNDRYIEGGTVDSRSSIVRTAFRMPPGMRNRDFVHSLHTFRIDSRTTIIAYGPEPADSYTVPNFIRCPMYPSGQRISQLSEDRLRIEHLMVYGLGGVVSPFLQNQLFRKAHVRAYLDEWSRLKELIREDIVEFGNA